MLKTPETAVQSVRRAREGNKVTGDRGPRGEQRVILHKVKTPR
jgi:hypothetical protein